MTASHRNLSNIADCMMARMDDLGDAAIAAMRSTPEAKALQAANSAKARAASKRINQRMVDGRAKAAATVEDRFAVGQMVRTARKIGLNLVTAHIVAIEGANVVLDNGRKFAASALVAA